MFNEKEIENIKGVDCPVWKTPKYEQSKKKALEIIESDKYGITEADFWILMNTYAKGTKVMYTGLILTHNGCLKINDNLNNDDKFKAEYLSREWLNNTLIYEYNDGVMYEVGEVNEENCKNPYIYAMAFKRCFDRVILKKSKLAFDGIYSEVEADEFKENIEEKDEAVSDYLINEFTTLFSIQEQEKIYEKYKIQNAYGLKKDIIEKYINFKKNDKK